MPPNGFSADSVSDLPTAVVDGYNFGVWQLEQIGIGTGAKVILRTVRNAANIIYSEAEYRRTVPETTAFPPPDHAVEVFVANLALAAGVRANQEEAEFSREELVQSLGFFGWFFNSLWHF